MMRAAKHHLGLAVILLGVLGGPSGRAEAGLIVGGPGDPGSGDCAPFGCSVDDYQQVYAASNFSGPITITSLTFFNNNYLQAMIYGANYEIELSTTSKAVNGLDTTFANNLGADNSVFFDGQLGGLVTAASSPSPGARSLMIPPWGTCS